MDFPKHTIKEQKEAGKRRLSMNEIEQSITDKVIFLLFDIRYVIQEKDNETNGFFSQVTEEGRRLNALADAIEKAI